MLFRSAFKQETGKMLLVTSGYRSNEKQKELYDATLALGTPGYDKEGRPVLPPGKSPHNKGVGIDVEIHPEYKIYIPELIFANLMTSSNYDDTEERIFGGTHGLGSKLTAIFSKKFKDQLSFIKSISFLLSQL